MTDLDAIQRLLKGGHAGGQARIDALTAFAQREVWVATWEPRSPGYRTLVNTTSEEALPLFTTERQLRDAAERFGWLDPKGNIATKKLPGRDAIRHAVARKYDFVVVDVAAAHALEITRDDLNAIADEVTGAHSKVPSRSPSRRPQTRRPSAAPIKEIKSVYPNMGTAGTYGAASVLPNALRKSRPPSAPTRKEPVPLSHPPPPDERKSHAAPAARPAQPPAQRPSIAVGGHVALASLAETPAAPMLEELAKTMRPFPEVEWAAFCIIKNDEGQSGNAVAIRLLGDFQDNLPDITEQVCEVGRVYGADLEVLLVDGSDRVREAKKKALVFYPWSPAKPNG